MRKYILAGAILAVTAATGYTASGGLVGDPSQVRSGVVGSDHGGNLILAKGDKSGTGPGAGGHKGQHKAERKGGQPHGEEGKGGKGKK
jgi:hypothetical protein